MMIVDAGLPDGDDLGMAGQFPEGGEEIESLRGDIVHMDANNVMDVREPLRERHGPTTAIYPRADEDDAGDADLCGP